MKKYAHFVLPGLLFCVVLLHNAVGDIMNDAQNGTFLHYAKIGEEIWMRGLGCFKFTEDFFHDIHRPFNYLPNDRSLIDTQFQLYTKRNPKEYVTLTADDITSVKESPYDSKFPTKFIVHGFIDNRMYGKWMEEMKDNLLLHGDYNVFIVDWSRGNSPPYSKAAANTRVVGAEIALMIRMLEKFKGVSPMDCHIIGHSLGSHIAGYAGKILKKTKLGRISAIDPAGPLFEHMPPAVRVDRTDADFVDVIHTDSQSILRLGLGMSQAIGHVDFYPNNGKQQPGCKTDVIRSVFLEGLVDATRRFIACNHQRAVDFFTYSINYHKVAPVGYDCSSWEDFIQGHCADCGKSGNKCAVMGIRADEYRALKNDSRSLKLYLQTSGLAPYWVYQYHVTLKLFKPKTKFVDQKGKMSIVLHGREGRLTVELTPQSIQLYHGASYKFVVKTKSDPGPIESISFTWISSSWNILKSKALHVEFLKISSMNVIRKREKNPCSMTFSDKPSKAIKSGSYVTLNQVCKKSSTVSYVSSAA